MESQNQFWYRRASVLVLKGQPDLVVLRGAVGKVFDGKTGRQRASDTIQIMIYMHSLPRCFDVYDGVEHRGCAVYWDQRLEIPAEAANAEFTEHFEESLDMFESAFEPGRTPRASECRFCAIAKPD